MRRLIIFLAVVALVAVFVPSASAARLSAADFAADCNDDGVVSVSAKQRYVGGTGDLTRDCIVTMEPGSKLVFRDATITGTGSLVAISSPADTTIRVVRSSIAVAGQLEMTAGCCSGEGDGSEAGGKVAVRDSRLSASSVQLVASFDDAGGKVSVRRSSVTATDGDIQIRASDLGGTDGRVRVKRSRLNAADDLRISTGTAGKTRVVWNDAAIGGSVEVLTGVDGTCRSRANTPELPCGVAKPPVGGDDGL
ncbi:MAG: hypothetical protein AAF480_15370 [Actinomycetota bacterium]